MRDIEYKDGKILVIEAPESKYASPHILLIACKPMCQPLQQRISIEATENEIEEHAKSLFDSVRTVCG